MNKKVVIDLVLEEFNDSVIRYGVRNNTDYTTLEILLNTIYDKLITINYNIDINNYSYVFYILLGYIKTVLSSELNKKWGNVCIKNEDFIKYINYFTDHNISKREIKDVLITYKNRINRLARGDNKFVSITMANVCNIPLRNTINKINAFCIVNCIDKRVSDYELKLIIKEFGHYIHKPNYEDIFLELFLGFAYGEKCITVQDIYNIINCYFIIIELPNEAFIDFCDSINKKRETNKKGNNIIYLNRVR